MIQFEHLGYFEEFLLPREGQWPKMLGSRIYLGELPKEQQGRPCGHEGMREFALTETIELRRGCNAVTVRASKKKPVQVVTFLNILNGKRIQ